MPRLGERLSIDEIIKRLDELEENKLVWEYKLLTETMKFKRTQLKSRILNEMVSK